MASGVHGNMDFTVPSGARSSPEAGDANGIGKWEEGGARRVRG